MATATIGLFDDRDQAQAVIEQLVADGFERSTIRTISSIDEFGALRGLADDAEFYREFVGRGGTAVVVQAPEDRIARAAEILSAGKSIDADTRSAEYREQGWSSARLRDYNERDIVMPVVEEQINVGKREVERGRLRVYTDVSEVPVEEQVSLREERISVERRPVDRPVSDRDLNAFEEGTFEVTARSEEAVVSKEARVVEEVVINKDTTERTETIRDTVRRTDVGVEEVNAERAVGDAYEGYSTQFRNYYTTNHSSGGAPYEHYDPAFRYGYSLAAGDRTRAGDWTAVESDARTRWEERNPGTWEQFKDSIRYAWDTVRGRR